jgi:hypothetical protein
MLRCKFEALHYAVDLSDVAQHAYKACGETSMQAALLGPFWTDANVSTIALRIIVLEGPSTGLTYLKGCGVVTRLSTRELAIAIAFEEIRSRYAHACSYGELDPSAVLSSAASQP